jgi:hypothetical protein
VHPAYFPVDFAGSRSVDLARRRLIPADPDSSPLRVLVESGHCLRLSAVPVSNQWRLGCIGFRSHVMATVLSIDGPLLQGQSPCVKGLRTPGVTLRSLPTRGGGAGDQSGTVSGSWHMALPSIGRAHQKRSGP